MITARIDGRLVPRDEVRSWERRRAVRVGKRLGVSATGELGELSERIVAVKLAMGHDGMERLLRRELSASALAARAGAAASRGQRRACTIELHGDTGRAERVPEWYAERMASNDERPLLAACPDHYLSRSNPDGSQEVIETTGGSPLAIRMFFDDDDTATVQTRADDAFPSQRASTARTASGTVIGGIRHQFRDEPGGGFAARLTVEFPWTTLPHMIAAHRWHLACEFSNWIEYVNDVHPTSGHPVGS